MNLQLIGGILIIAGCGGVGFGMALNYKREEAALEKLYKALEFMNCELAYRLTPLPELCRKVGSFSQGRVGQVFSDLAEELDRQISPNVSCCMEAVLEKIHDLPGKTRSALLELGRTLGCFDLEGQVSGITLVKELCEKEMESLATNRTQRIRCYQTLGLCAGAALAILFI